MSIFDILIIYFTLAAPYAVYRYFLEPRPLTKRIWHISIVNFIFGVPLAMKSLVSLAFAKIEQRQFQSLPNIDINEQRILRIESRLRKNIRRSNNNLLIKSFDEVLERYVGLTLSATVPSQVSRGHELFSISGHPKKSLAAECLNNRNHARLERHRQKASQDFLKILKQASFDEGFETVMRSIELAEILGDKPTAEKIIADLKQPEAFAALTPAESVLK